MILDEAEEKNLIIEFGFSNFFRFNIKNKTELKKLLKQLNIDIDEDIN